MKKQQDQKEILALLDEHYGTKPHCYLSYESDWQLLVAAILSAQCTDERANKITAVLFATYGTIDALADAKLEEIESIIKSAGLYHSKAKNILAAARVICDKHGGMVPSSLEELTALPGVGRKTANVIRGHIHGIPSIVVDTHVKRVSQRLGLTSESNPEKIEFDLMRILPEDRWIRFNTQIIAHGRSLCKALAPKCQQCFLADSCPAKTSFLLEIMNNI